MSRRTPKLYLNDIKKCIKKIQRYVDDISFKDFKKNEMLVDAVFRNIEIIGEASSQLPNDIKKTNTQVPWKDIIGMRHKMIHDYFGINHLRVWNTINDKLPELLEQIIEIEGNYEEIS